MGCQISAVIDGHHSGHTIVAAFGLRQVNYWFACWESCLSRFRPNSELCRLNRSPETWVRVSDTLWQVLQSALNNADWTAGLVTPTVLGALESIGYDRSFERLHTPDAAQAPIGPTHSVCVTDYQTIQCNPVQRSVRIPRGIRLDLGGIAKGWAADQTARRLQRFGPALVDVGGDIATGLGQAKYSWPIGVAGSSQHHEPLALALPHGLAIATSGRDYRYWIRDGETYHHVIDPRTGLDAKTDVLSATVIAPSAQQAEAAAKAALILGQQAGLAWIESQPFLAGLLMLEDGSRRLSQHMRRYMCPL